MEMMQKILKSLKDQFGYDYDLRSGEQFVIYQELWLIVIHAERKPRLYSTGCEGSYTEININILQ